MTALRGRAALYLLFLYIPVSLLAGSTRGYAEPAVDYPARQTFMKARQAMRDGAWTRARTLERSLDRYPLKPYLTYYRLRANVASARASELRSFLSDYDQLPVTPLLRTRWLRHLGAQKRWREFLDDWEPRTSADLACYHLRARLSTGDGSALDDVAALWTVGKSQPKACDPLFAQWIAAGRLTESRVWQRLQLALGSNERGLARYLTGLLSEPKRGWGELYQRAHTRPVQITSSPLLSADSPWGRDIIDHAINRLTRRGDLSGAEALWRQSSGWGFSESQRTRIVGRLISERAEAGQYPDTLVGIDADTLARIGRSAIIQQNWPKLVAVIEALPLDARSSDRWQYWLARALERTYGNIERTRLTLEALANQRSYHGFLAAELLRRAPTFNARTAPADPAALRRLERNPRVARALELLAVREPLAAGREWRGLLATLDEADRLAAAQLAARVGWLRQSISAANAAGVRDDLTLRFPVAHRVEYQRMSQATGVPVTFLMAITRQESAFDPRARSSANARGLMQLLPSTAGWVANRIGTIRPTKTALYRPSTNIELGSHYLAYLLDRYNGSRPLAAAAYNAGERRVDRWTAELDAVPIDVWIESIPFRETRNYVQNVLAFNQVYNARLDSPAPTLYDGELEVTDRRAAAPQAAGQ
ncbi:MAG: transglycosylase SLT domain-containing protein [Pseudomonadota bacterium]